MPVIARPETPEEMLYQLWFAVIGSNGDGLASQVRDTRERVSKIEAVIPTLLPREAHEAEATECRERRKLSRREITMLALTGLGSLGAIGAVIVSIVALGGA